MKAIKLLLNCMMYTVLRFGGFRVQNKLARCFVKTKTRKNRVLELKK